METMSNGAERKRVTNLARVGIDVCAGDCPRCGRGICTGAAALARETLEDVSAARRSPAETEHALIRIGVRCSQVLEAEREQQGDERHATSDARDVLDAEKEVRHG